MNNMWLHRIVSAVISLLLLLHGGEALHINDSRTVEDSFLPGALWNDTEGATIQAHGGQVLYMPVPDGKGGHTQMYVWSGKREQEKRPYRLRWGCPHDFGRSLPLDKPGRCTASS